MTIMIFALVKAAERRQSHAESTRRARVMTNPVRAA